MPTDCDAIVVSDLHLGRPGKSRPKQVRRFFEALADGRFEWRPARVVLAGDVFEDLDLRHWPDSHWQALAAIRKVERSIPVAWVRGNHDGPFDAVEFMAWRPDLAEPVGADIRSGDTRVLVTHGKWEAKWADDPRTTVTHREATEKLRDQWAGYDRHGLREAVAVARGVVTYARLKGFDAVVCGHTHGPFCGTLDGFPYANAGSWTKGQTPTFVTLAGGSFAVRRYEPAAD